VIFHVVGIIYLFKGLKTDAAMQSMDCYFPKQNGCLGGGKKAAVIVMRGFTSSVHHSKQYGLIFRP